MLKRLLPSRKPSIPVGQRVYAIGDVHGRLDLLDKILMSIEADSAARGDASVTLVLLGDLVDRGPESRGVLDRVRAGVGWAETIALKGNHEAIMLDALDGDLDLLTSWLRFGGRETLASWGVLAEGDGGEIVDAALAAIPEEDRAWLAALPTQHRAGDYYFVHAGIRPGVALDRQIDDDRLWIRKDFLDSVREHGAVVVHGHTISEAVEMLPNRIGIDTGAYASDRLTALGLEGEERWLLST